MAKYLQAQKLSGKITLCGDKSISHRALILAALSSGQTIVRGLNRGQDVMHLAKAITQLGACVTFKPEHNLCLIDGAGIGCLLEPQQPFYLGNSGTAARLLIGAIAPYNIKASFTGDTSLQSRPMTRIIEPLQQTGAQFSVDRYLPLQLLGNPCAVPIDLQLKIASAQVKSALLFAALSIEGRSIIIENTPTRDHTERMLELFAADIQLERMANATKICITGAKALQASTIAIPGDFSAAAFLIAAAILVPGSEVELTNVGLNPTRTGFLTCLQEMGADIEITNPQVISNEPVGNLKIRHCQLSAIDVPASRAALMIDEYPILAVLAAFAKGETTLHGLTELKVKESNRLLAIAAGLNANNVLCHISSDSLRIVGTNPDHIGGAVVSTHMDHRIAMSFLVMGLASAHPISVDNITYIGTSFPEFFDILTGFGAQIYG